MAAKRRTDTASRVIRATPEAVHEALLDPAAVAAWHPPAGMRGEILAFDARPGGTCRMALIYEDATARGKTSASADVVGGIGAADHRAAFASTLANLAAFTE